MFIVLLFQVFQVGIKTHFCFANYDRSLVFLIFTDTQPHFASSSSSSSSSLAQESLLIQGLLQKLLPAVPIPCSIPPISLPKLPSHHLLILHSACPSVFFLSTFQVNPITSVMILIFIRIKHSTNQFSGP